jgi:dephospho-CoA kinase
MSTDAARGRRRERGADPLFIVGLIGRAGSGKTTVARAFAARGVPVLDADAIGHEVTRHDPEVRAALSAEYGAEVYRPDGSLDRARVADRVFRDRQALARLNALVHPRIAAGLRERLESLRRESRRGPVIVDAAVMLDWGFERECDLVVAVVASDADAVARLEAARGWSEEEARRRLAGQRSSESLAAAADVVLENTGTESELIEAAWRAVVAALPAAARPGERA